MDVYPVRAASDNYMYVLTDKERTACAVVDPLDAEKVLKFIRENHIPDPQMILTTHHHMDHAGGNDRLQKLLHPNSIPVYGGTERVQGVTQTLSHHDRISVGKNLQVECFHTPGHTEGHICYYVTVVDGKDTPCVFTGDTLFIAGCGRLFEGTAAEMYTSLNKIIGYLPPETLVYCGHEYTVHCLKFALTVEPHNEAIKKKLQWAEEQVRKGLPTVPSTIADECDTNPFMRVDKESVMRHARSDDPIMTLSIIRSQKDAF